MVQYRAVAFLLGLILAALAATMLVPLLVEVGNDHANWRAFAASAAITLFVAGALIAGGWSSKLPRMTAREGFLLTFVSWVAAALFGAIPFALSDLRLGFTEAFFETVSGITTTGATLIKKLEEKSRGILMWRALLQGIGGIGIVVMVVALFPYLRVGGMQLFRSESSEKFDKPLPRAAEIALATVLVYVVLLIACGVVYWALGMSLFDSATHAMTTVATAGFANYDESFGAFKSPALEWAAVGFMALSALPLLIFLRAVTGRWRDVFGDTQVRWFVLVILAAVAVTALWLWRFKDLPPDAALRLAAFNMVSIGTTTGYASTDYGQWGSFTSILFIMLMFIGGCTGSTAGGVKVMRYEVMGALAADAVRRMVHRRGVFQLRYAGRPLSEDVLISVMVFCFVYFMSFAVLAAGLAALGLDFVTSVTGAAAAVGNIGPGLGEIIGPAGDYSAIPDPAKWLLSFGMILGRLEYLAALVLFTRRFWRG